jgi:AraC-like DNA-binding protein
VNDHTVVAFVSLASRPRLLAALPELSCVSSWNELATRIESSREVVAIIENERLAAHLSDLRQVHHSCPGVSVLLYLRLEPGSVRGCLDAIHAGATDLIFAGFDDSPERLGQIIDTALARGRRTQNARPFLKVLAQLPPSLRAAAESMFRSPERFHTTSDLARAAGMSNRTVFRCLKRCRVRSGRRLIAAARALAAYDLLRLPRRTVHEVARQLGYASAHQLSAHLAELANCTCRDIRRGHPEESFFDAVAASIFSSPAETAELATAHD